jgi:hypothetical protein
MVQIHHWWKKLAVTVSRLVALLTQLDGTN